MDRPARRRAQKARRVAAVAACDAHDAQARRQCSTAALLGDPRPALGAAAARGVEPFTDADGVGGCRPVDGPGGRSGRAALVSPVPGLALSGARRRAAGSARALGCRAACRRRCGASSARLGCCSFTKAGRAVRHAVTRADRRPPLGPAGASRRQDRVAPKAGVAKQATAARGAAPGPTPYRGRALRARRSATLRSRRIPGSSPAGGLRPVA